MAKKEKGFIKPRQSKQPAAGLRPERPKRPGFIPLRPKAAGLVSQMGGPVPDLSNVVWTGNTGYRPGTEPVPPVPPQRDFLSALIPPAPPHTPGRPEQGLFYEPKAVDLSGMLDLTFPQHAVEWAGDLAQEAGRRLPEVEPGNLAELFDAATGLYKDFSPSLQAILAYPQTKYVTGLYQYGLDYPIQILNQIGKLPQRIWYTWDKEKSRLGVVDLPAWPSEGLQALEDKFSFALGDVGAASPEVQAAYLQALDAAEARRVEWETYAMNGHEDPALNGQEVNWERVIGTPFDPEGTNTIPKLQRASGVTGIGFSLMVNPEAEKNFYEQVKAGMPIEDAILANEDWKVQLIGETLTDPLNFLPTAWTQRLFPAGKFLFEGGVETAAGVRRFAVGRSIETLGGFTELAGRKVVSEFKGKYGGVDIAGWLVALSKRSRYTKYSDLAGDALHTAANQLPENLKAVPIEGFQRVILEGMDGKGPLLEALPIRFQKVVKDFAAHLKSKDLTGLPEILEKYGTFAEQVAVTPGGRAVVTKMLEGATDPHRLAEYLRQAVTHQYALELGFSIRPRGAVGRFMTWTGALLKENWLGVNVAYQLANGTDNVIKTFVSNYTYNPFDLPNAGKLQGYLGKYGVWLPDEVNRSSYLEILGLERTGLAPTEQIPFPGIGTPEGTFSTVDTLFGWKTSKWYKESWLGKSGSIPARLLRGLNYGTLLKGGRWTNSWIENTARMNIFWQAFQGSIEGKARPGWIAAIEKDPVVPPEVVNRLRNPTQMKSPEDFDSITAPFLQEEAPTVDLAAYPYEAAGPVSNGILSDLGKELTTTQGRYDYDFKDSNLELGALVAFKRAQKAGEDHFADYMKAVEETTRTPQEQLDAAWVGPKPEVEPEIIQSARLRPKEQAFGREEEFRLAQQEAFATGRKELSQFAVAGTQEEIEKDLIGVIAGRPFTKNTMLGGYITWLTETQGITREDAALQLLDVLDEPGGLQVILGRAGELYNEGIYPAGAGYGTSIETSFEDINRRAAELRKQKGEPVEPGAPGKGGGAGGITPGSKALFDLRTPNKGLEFLEPGEPHESRLIQKYKSGEGAEGDYVSVSMNKTGEVFLRAGPEQEGIDYPGSKKAAVALRSVGLPDDTIVTGAGITAKLQQWIDLDLAGLLKVGETDQLDWGKKVWQAAMDKQLAAEAGSKLVDFKTGKKLQPNQVQKGVYVQGKWTFTGGLDVEHLELVTGLKEYEPADYLTRVAPGLIDLGNIADNADAAKALLDAGFDPATKVARTRGDETTLGELAGVGAGRGFVPVKQIIPPENLPGEGSIERQFYSEVLNKREDRTFKALINLDNTKYGLWPVSPGSTHYESMMSGLVAGANRDSYVAVSKMPLGEVYLSRIVQSTDAIEGVGYVRAQQAAQVLKAVGLADDTIVTASGISASLKDWVDLELAELVGKYSQETDAEGWATVAWERAMFGPPVKPLKPYQLGEPLRKSPQFKRASMQYKFGTTDQLNEPLVIAAWSDGRVGWNYGTAHDKELIIPAGYTRNDTEAWGQWRPDLNVWAVGGERVGVENILKYLETNLRGGNGIVRITLDDSPTDQFMYAGELRKYWEWAEQTQAAGLRGGGIEGMTVGPEWRSKLEDAINLLGERFDPQVAKRTFVGAGVSLDERKWTGIDDFLNSKTGPVTKQELLDYYNANKVELQTVQKTKAGKAGSVRFEIAPHPEEPGGNYYIFETRYPDDPDGARYKFEYNPENGVLRVYTDIGEYGYEATGTYTLAAELDANDLPQAEEATRRWLAENVEGMGQMHMGEEIGGTQYGQYVLPGGENYREFLLTLPVQPSTPDVQAAAKRLRTPGLTEAPEDIATVGRGISEREAGTYESPHWQEPNVVVHIRADDRIGPAGEKVLFVQEIQSDWMQQAQKVVEVLKDVQKIRPLKPIEQELLDAGGMIPGPQVGRYEAGVWGTIRDTWNREAGGPSSWRTQLLDPLTSEWGRILDEAADIAPPPPGPFSKTWHELAVRKMFRQAAEEGYDMVAFPTADAVAVAEGWDVITNVHEGDAPAGGWGVDAMKEGARVFYEEKVQNYVRKFGRKWGAETEHVTLSAVDKLLLGQEENARLAERYGLSTEREALTEPGGTWDVPAVRISDDMRRSIVEEGLPVFGGLGPRQGRPPQPGVGGGDLPPEYRMWDDAQRGLRDSLTEKAQGEYVKFQAELKAWERATKAKIKAGQRKQKQSEAEIAARRAAFNRYRQQWQEHLDTGARYASSEVERILFDYASLSNWEEMLRSYAPFTTWQLRNPLFWAQATLQRPGMVNLWYRYQVESERQRKRLNLTNRFRGTLPLVGPQGLFGEGGPGSEYLAGDIQGAFGPGAQFGQPFEPIGTPPPANAFEATARKVFEAEQWLGVRPWPWIQAAERAAGLRQPGLQGDLFGPVQQLPGVGGVLDTAQAALGMGPTQSNQDLLDYYVNRRLSEKAAQGLISYEDAYWAQFHKDNPLYQQTLTEIQGRLDTAQAVRTFVPMNIKYASPGEQRIRGLVGKPREELYGGEFQQTPKYPFLNLYSRLFRTEEERAIEDQVKAITEKYDQELKGLKPDEAEWYDVQRQKAQEIAAVYANRPPIEGEKRAVFPAHPLEKNTRFNVLSELEDQEPKPGMFLLVGGEIDWDAYEEAYDSFLAQVPGLSEKLGLQVSSAEYDRFQNRYKTVDEMMVVLNRARLKPGYDLQEKLYDANSTEFAAALQQLLTQQIQEDVAAGLSEEDAQGRAAATAQYVQENGLPFEFIQQMLEQYGPEPASEMIGKLGQMRPELLEGLQPGDVGYELPGLGGAKTRMERARQNIIDFYYDSLPTARDRIRQQLGISSDANFTDEIRLLSDDTATRYWYEMSRAGRVQVPAANQEKLEQVERDFYIYNQAKAAGEEPTWTPLMEELYGHRESASGKFWEKWTSQEEWSAEAFGDPLIQLILDRETRKTATDGQFAEALRRLESYAAGEIPEGRSIQDVFWDLWWSKRYWPNEVWDDSGIARIMNRDTRADVSDPAWEAALELLRRYKEQPASSSVGGGGGVPSTEAPPETRPEPTAVPEIGPTSTPGPVGPPPPTPPSFPPPPPPPGGMNFLPAGLRSQRV